MPTHARDSRRRSRNVRQTMGARGPRNVHIGARLSKWDEKRERERDRLSSFLSLSRSRCFSEESISTGTGVFRASEASLGGIGHTRVRYSYTRNRISWTRSAMPGAIRLPGCERGNGFYVRVTLPSMNIPRNCRAIMIKYLQVAKMSRSLTCGTSIAILLADVMLLFIRFASNRGEIFCWKSRGKLMTDMNIQRGASCTVISRDETQYSEIKIKIKSFESPSRGGE